MRYTSLIPLLLVDTAIASAQSEGARDYTSSEWWLVYLTAALSVFTLGLMLYTARLWRATVRLSRDAESNARLQRDDTIRALAASERAAKAAERSAEVAAQTLVAAQRAFVFFKGFAGGPHLWDDKVKEYVVFADAENVGATPALDVRVTMRLHIARGIGTQPPVFTPETGSTASTVMGPRSSIRTAFLPIPIADLIACWEERSEIFVWCHLQYRDILDTTVLHHHEQCAKIHFIHDPSTPPPKDHPPYIQFTTFGPQNATT